MSVLRDVKEILKMAFNDMIDDWLFMERKQKIGVFVTIVIVFVVYYFMVSSGIKLGFMGMF